MKKNFTILMLLAFCCLGLNAKTVKVEVTEVITGTEILKQIGSDGDKWEVYKGLTFSSNAEYEAKCWVNTNNKNVIWLNTSDASRAFVTTKSGGNAKQITVTWSSSTPSYRGFDFYGKSGPFTSTDQIASGDYNWWYGNVCVYDGTGDGEVDKYDILDSWEYIGFGSNDQGIYLKKVEITWEVEVQETPVVVGPSGISSYCSEYPRDFAGTGVTAYVATGIEGTSVILEEITKVPRGVGVIVMGDPGTYTVPDIKEADEPETNFLVGVNKATDIKYRNDENGFINYVLLRHKETGDVAFHPLTSENNYTYTVLAGKSYLSIPASYGAHVVPNAPLKLYVDGDEVTGIEAVNCEEVENGDCYNLQGIKVDSNYKGFVIKNGKKFYNR